MADPKAPAKKPSVDAAFQEEVKRRARGPIDALKAWVASGADERPAEEVAAKLSPLDPASARKAARDAIDEIEGWLERRFDAHATALAKDKGVGKADLVGDEVADRKGWLADAVAAELEPIGAALDDRKAAGAELVSVAARADEAELASPRRRFAAAGEALTAALERLSSATQRRAETRFAERVEKLAKEGEERALAAVRDRAERAAARRAAPKKPEAEVPKARDDGKRRWYHWILDAALLGAAAYLVYTRFLAKQPQPPAEHPAAMESSSAASSARAAVSGVPITATEVRAGPGMLYAPVETLGGPSHVQLLEGPTAGWVKVRTAASKDGWIPIEAIGTVPTPAPSATRSP